MPVSPFRFSSGLVSPARSLGFVPSLFLEAFENKIGFFPEKRFRNEFSGLPGGAPLPAGAGVSASGRSPGPRLRGGGGKGRGGSGTLTLAARAPRFAAPFALRVNNPGPSLP